MEDIENKNIDDIVDEIENATAKKKKNKRKKKKKAKNIDTLAVNTQDKIEGPSPHVITSADQEPKVLASLENKYSDTVKGAPGKKFEEEETKVDISVTDSVPSAKSKNKGKKKNKKNKGQQQSAPKPAKEAKFKLKRIEVDSEFWKGYDSEEASSDSDAESLKEYTKGGYHPVHVGETFKGRYRILKKLGWGAFSTVWFSHDMKNNKFVAIKVQKSGESYYSAAEDEIEILEVIADKWKDDEWMDSIKEYNEVQNINSCHCMHMMDHFEFEGPNGKHIGMVFEVMGYNLLKIMKLYDWEGIPVPIVRVIAKQILIGLDYLHRMCDVIHTDIKPENAILYPTLEQLKNHLDSVPEHFKSHIKGKVQESQFFSKEQNEINKRRKKNLKKKKKRKEKKATENGAKEDGKDDNTEKDNASEKPDGPIGEDVQVKICDFGNGCWTDHHYTSTIQTRQYRSPEVILGIEYDETCDLWSFACMIFELITGDYLFDPKSGDKYSKEEDHIAYIAELIGYPEFRWLKTAKRFRKYFTTTGKMKRILKHKEWHLEDVLKDKYCFKPDEAEKLADFLGMVLQWKNEDRATAQEMLEHEWLSMPADYDCRVDSDEEEEEETPSKNGDTPAKDKKSDINSKDEWETLSSDNSDFDSDSSEFELIDHPEK